MKKYSNIKNKYSNSIQATLVMALIAISFSPAISYAQGELDANRCDYLKIESAKEHCKNESKDNWALRKYQGKPFSYLAKDLPLTINEVKTLVGLTFYVDRMMLQSLDANTLDLTKEEKTAEYNSIKEIYARINKRFEQINKEQESAFAEWNKKQVDSSIIKFAENRSKTKTTIEHNLKVLHKSLMNEVSYLEAKRINRDIVRNLYLSNSVLKVKPSECLYIKESLPNLYDRQKHLLKGCK